jgi:hypothetical protein
MFETNVCDADSIQNLTKRRIKAITISDITNSSIHALLLGENFFIFAFSSILTSLIIIKHL